MTRPVLVGTDGSDRANRSVAAGLRVVDPAAPVVLALVVEPPDPSLVTGGGHAGGTMTPEEFDALDHERRASADAALVAAATTLGLGDADRRMVPGVPGPALVALAAELDAGAIVIGTRGRGGVKRALLGSVSDHVVRNAPCPVVVTTDPTPD